MEIGHSRLLKLLLSNNSPEMSAKHHFTVQYITIPTQPSAIESQVPEQQSLRQPVEIVNDAQENKQENTDDDSTFVPVFNTTKEEAVLTKGDLKLQKISVTENISVNSAVPNNEQPLRMAPDNTTIKTEDNKTGNDENKPRSRIPKLRQAAEKFKQAMKEEREKEKEVNSRPRRSSIPKLKRNRRRSNKDVEKKPDNDNNQTTHKKENINNTPLDKPLDNNIESILPPEEEFDKIFGEIINVDDTPVMDSSLIDNLEDAERLEYSFEEIVHDYEENKLQPIDVNKTVRKIPLVRQKSLPEETIVRQTARKLSLKDIPIDHNENHIRTNVKLSALDQTERIFEKKRKTRDDDTTKPVETEIERSENIEKVSTKLKNYTERKTSPNTNEINKNETNQLVEKANSSDLDNTNRTPNSTKLIMNIVEQNMHEMYEKPHLIEDTLPAIKREFNRLPEKQSTTEISQNISNNLHPVKDVTSEKWEEVTKTDEQISPTKIPILRGKVLQLTSKYASSEQSPITSPKKEFEIPKQKSTSSRIAVFSKDNNNDKTKPSLEVHHQNDNNSKKNESSGKVSMPSKIDDDSWLSNDLDTDLNSSERLKVSLNEMRKLDREAFEKLKFVGIEGPGSKFKLHIHKSITPPNTPQVNENDAYKDSSYEVGEPKILNIDDEAYQENKHVYELNKNQDVEHDCEKNVHIINKSARDVYNKLDSDSAFPTKDYALQNPDELNRPLLDDAVNINLNEDAEHDYSINGKVSRLISRIYSVDEKTLDSSQKENAVTIPIKKSVSSRIAMFERQTSTPSELRFNPKPRTDIGPRIIEEVLKAPPTRGIPSGTVTQANTLGNKSNKIQTENIEYVAQVIDIKELGLTTDREEEVTEIGNTEEKVNIEGELVRPNIGEQHNKRKQSDIRDVESIRAKDNKQSRMEHLQNENGLPAKGKEVVVLRVKERIKRLKSVTEDGDIKKSTVFAERELGEAVKGKVHQLIVRMNSMEKIEVEKKNNNIKIKERPRSKSVSEKIALFEKKLVPVEMDTTTATIKMADRSIISTPANVSTPNTCPKPPTNDEDLYNERIEELKNGKLKYGQMDENVYVELRTGQKMPALILGTALLDPILLPHIVATAIDLGYRAIDTANIYGNEKQIGDVIRAKIEDGTVKREELFIIGKLWSTFHRRDLVEKACRVSLEQLGLDYFDLYLVHNPMSFKEGGHPLPKLAGVLRYSEVDYLEAWYGMEDVFLKGLAKSIGVSNFNSVQIAKIVDKGKIKPSVNQVECHPYLTQQRLDQFCADRGVKLACFGTLGSKGTPAEYKGSQASVIDDPLVQVMAAGLNFTSAQLLIRFQLECGHGVVVKSSSAVHLWENLQAQKLRLSEAEVDALNALNRNKRTYVFKGMGDTHPNYPFKIPY